MSMQSIGSIGAQVMYDWTHDKDDPDYLRGHPGNAVDVLRSAASRMKHHAAFSSMSIAEFHKAMEPLEAEYSRVQHLCESPIERDMLAALMTANWHALPNPFVPVLDQNAMGLVPDMPVAIIPQFVFMRYRFDFAVTIKAKHTARIIAVECDGAEFHDPGKDRIRDTNLWRLGILTRRFTGSRIHSAVTDLADSVVSSACSVYEHG